MTYSKVRRTCFTIYQIKKKKTQNIFKRFFHSAALKMWKSSQNNQNENYNHTSLKNKLYLSVEFF